MRPRQLATFLMAAFLLLGYAGASQGATTSSNLTVNTNIAARAALILGSATINFPDADPSVVTSIAATENPVSVTARVRTGSASVASLQVLAGGDMMSGTDVITMDNVTWTATGPGFAAGTMNKTTAQSAGSWTGSGERIGSFSYLLANSWNYAAGSYSVTVTYTLTAP